MYNLSFLVTTLKKIPRATTSFIWSHKGRITRIESIYIIHLGFAMSQKKNDDYNIWNLLNWKKPTQSNVLSLLFMG